MILLAIEDNNLEFIKLIDKDFIFQLNKNSLCSAAEKANKDMQKYLKKETICD